VPHIVAIEGESAAAILVQVFLDGMCQGRLAGTGKTREPQHHTVVPI